MTSDPLPDTTGTITYNTFNVCLFLICPLEDVVSFLYWTQMLGIKIYLVAANTYCKAYVYMRRWM